MASGTDRIRKTEFGTWLIDDDTYFTRLIEEEGRLDHDRYMLSLLLPFIPAGGTVVDAGAYIGDHTAAYLKAVGPAGCVYAFEPNPLPYACLQLNCPSAISLMMGLGAAATAAGYRDIGGNIGASSLAPFNETDKSVALVALDMFSMPCVDYIKLDIEGCETAALHGAVNLIRRDRPVICVEVNEANLRNQGSSRAELFSAIFDLGYQIHRFGDHDWALEHYDCLALPCDGLNAVGADFSDPTALGLKLSKYRRAKRKYSSDHQI